MGEWKKVKLGDCIKEVIEKTTVNNQYEVLTSSKDGIFSQEDYFDKQVASKNNVGYKIIRKGQFTYRSMSDSGRFTINKLDNKDIGIVSPAYPVFEAKGINSDYLKYFFDSEIFRKAIHNLSQGSTRTALKYKDLIEIEMLLPTIKEQERIVGILEKVDLIIKKYKILLEEKNKFIKSQFVEMFIKSNKYKKVVLNSVIEEMFIGPFGSSLKNECFVNEKDGYCVVYEQKHAINQELNDFRFVDEKKYKELKKFTILSDDIIVSCRGTIGKTYLVPYNAPLGIMHPSIMKIRIKKEEYNPLFFNYLLQYDLLKNNTNDGSTIQMAIKAKDLGKKEVIKPDKKIQEKYIQYIQLIDKQKFELERIIENYKNLKKGLMQQLLTGKIKVKI